MNLNLYSKKLSKYKKTVLAKAALLTGLTLSFVGCGTPQAKPKYESKTDSAKMEVVQDTTELVDEELTETSTVDTIEGKVSTTENGKTTEQQTAYVVDPETKTTESIGEITTEKTTEKGGKTTTTVVTTTSKTNDKTTNKTTTGKTTTGKTTTGKTTTSKTTTNKTTQPTTTTVVTTTKVTTAKPTTTTTTTTAPVQTEPIVTTIPYENRTYTKYDMLSSDPVEAAYAFDQLSEELCSDLFNGYMVMDESYGMTAGHQQSKIILAALNYYYNGGIRPEVLAHEEALGDFSRDDIQKYSINADLPQEQYFYGSRVDFNKYVLDDNFANELEDITNKYFDWKNGNAAPLESELDSYFEYNNYDNLQNINNFIKFYYMCKISYEYDYIDDDSVIKQIFFDNLIGPMYDNYEPYKGYSFSR